MKKIKKVPKFKTIEEIANFWDTHSTADYPDFWKPVYEEIITLDEDTVKAVKKVAKKKGLRTETAARMLIRERLSEMKII